MRRPLVLTVVIAVLALAASPAALASTQIGGSVDSWMIVPTSGVATVTGTTTCSADVLGASLTLMLTQNRQSQTVTIPVTCAGLGSVPFAIALNGYHAGMATLQVCWDAFSNTGTASACTFMIPILLLPGSAAQF